MIIERLRDSTLYAAGLAWALVIVLMQTHGFVP
jgi:hypothetical protein